MKILAINNYPIDEVYRLAQIGSMPSHHCWGVDFLRKKGDFVRCLLYKNPFVSHSYIITKVINTIYELYFNLKVLLMSYKYDVIISFATPLIRFIPFFKSIGLCKANLITLVHHFGDNIILNKKNGGYDYILFLSQDIMRYYEKSGYKGNFKCLQWGPDLCFYSSFFLDMQKTIESRSKAFVCVSTGKTNRDINLFLNACKSSGIDFVIITDKVNSTSENIIQSKKNGNNAVPYLDMMKYLSHTAVNVVPICNAPSGTLCGLTSVLDGLALGLPLVIADNSNIGIDFALLNIGIQYKHGNIKDLEEKLIFLKNNMDLYLQMSKNARNYAEKYSYENYCKNLYGIIHENMNNI